MPHDDVQQVQFLKSRPNTDLFMVMEGEVTTKLLINKILINRGNPSNIFNEPLEGDRKSVV